MTADLVVVGFGAAGAAAAITAADLGASVVVLEKQGADRHTPSVRMSGGMVMVAEDAAPAAEYLDACAGGMVPADVSAAWAAGAHELLAWWDKAGVGVPLQHTAGAEHPELPGAAAISVHQPAGAGGRLDPSAGGGPRLWEGLAGAVAARPQVTMRWESPARRLLRDAGGAVVGVETADGSVVEAGRGVVLCPGGFEFDPWLVRNHLRTDPVRFYGNPGNTGDGVRMAAEVGAELWHMNQMVGRGVGWFPLDDGTELGFIIQIGPPGYVIVDRHGRRFADEESQALLRHDFYYHLLAFDSARGEYPRNPCYWLFDRRRLEAGPLTLAHIGAVGVGLYDWSADNTREVARGWIATGGTPQEAAAAAGCADPEEAGRSVAAYNAGCAAGDDAFGRDPATLVPLDQPPFACVPLWAGGSNTSGGPRRDASARILDVHGEPIPGLFGAGELGQVLGLLYPADGSNLSDAFVFGRLAAETSLG